MMNEWDRSNLKFIIHSPHQEFDAWLLQASNDDIRYALELIALAKRENASRALNIDPPLTGKNFKEAKTLLKKFMLGKKNV
jgi:hypothetical protein